MPDRSDLRLVNYRSMPRLRHEIQDRAYRDRTETSAAMELFTEVEGMELLTQANQKRNVRAKYMRMFGCRLMSLYHGNPVQSLLRLMNPFLLLLNIRFNSNQIESNPPPLYLLDPGPPVSLTQPAGGLSQNVRLLAVSGYNQMLVRAQTIAVPGKFWDG